MTRNKRRCGWRHDEMIWWSKQQLKSKDPKSRERAVEKLVAEGGARAVEALAEALKHGELEVRKTAASALGELRDEAAVNPLADALRDPKDSVRAVAARSLGRCGSALAVAPLVAALQDSATVVRWAAARRYGTGSPRAISPVAVNPAACSVAMIWRTPVRGRAKPSKNKLRNMMQNCSKSMSSRVALP